MQKINVFFPSLKHQIWRWTYYFFNKEEITRSVEEKEKENVKDVADAAMLRFDAPAFRLMKMVMQCVRRLIVGLICVNYTHSAKEIIFHI